MALFWCMHGGNDICTTEHTLTLDLKFGTSIAFLCTIIRRKWSQKFSQRQPKYTKPRSKDSHFTVSTKIAVSEDPNFIWMIVETYATWGCVTINFPYKLITRVKLQNFPQGYCPGSWKSCNSYNFCKIYRQEFWKHPVSSWRARNSFFCWKLESPTKEAIRNLRKGGKKGPLPSCKHSNTFLH